MRNKQDPVEFILEENPELDWDDLHDVREVAELLGAMVEDLEKKVYEPDCWLEVSEHLDELEDHYFYLVTHADFGTPMKAKYHDDMGGYFEIKSSDKKIPVEYVNPIIGESKIKYFMPLPEMPEDYKGHGPLYKFLEKEEYQKIVESGDKRALAHYKNKHGYTMTKEEMDILDEDRVEKTSRLCDDFDGDFDTEAQSKAFQEALQGIKSYAKASPNLLDRDECEGCTCYQFFTTPPVSCGYLTKECVIMKGCYDLTCNKKQTGISIPFSHVCAGLEIHPDAFNEEEF